MTDGNTLGAMIGSEDGITMGMSDCMADGTALGDVLGIDDGIALGMPDVKADGNVLVLTLLGIIDGNALGMSLDASLSKTDGCMLCNTLGIADGIRLGIPDGSLPPVVTISTSGSVLEKPSTFTDAFKKAVIPTLAAFIFKLAVKDPSDNESFMFSVVSFAILPTEFITFSHVSAQVISSMISNSIFASLILSIFAEAALLTGISLISFTFTSILFSALNISVIVCSITCDNVFISSESSDNATLVILITQGTVN